MKISLLEPIGVSRETIDALAAPVREMGHTFTIMTPRPRTRRNSSAEARAARWS